MQVWKSKVQNGKMCTGGKYKYGISKYSYARMEKQVRKNRVRNNNAVTRNTTEITLPSNARPWNRPRCDRLIGDEGSSTEEYDLTDDNDMQSHDRAHRAVKKFLGFKRFFWCFKVFFVFKVFTARCDTHMARL